MAVRRVIRRGRLKFRRLLGGSRHALVGDEALWQFKRAFQIRFVREHGLQPGDVFLDIGCGTLRGGIPVIDYLEAGNYIGVETRADVVAEAQRELAEAALEHKAPKLIVSDMGDLALDRPVDFAWAFSVLIHMADEILGECLATVGRALAPGGVFYANVNIGEGTIGEWQGFPVNQRPLEFYEQQARMAGMDVVDVGALGELGHVSGIPRQDAQRMLRFTQAAG